MTLAIVYSRASLGMHAPLVTVEVHISKGMPCFSIVGVPETAVKESRYRVRSALLNCGFDFPSKRITVNLAPADLPKEGGRFDLPIAVGILVAQGYLSYEAVLQYEMVGELALSGQLRAVQGVLPVALSVSTSGRQLIIPQQNAREVSIVSTCQILQAESLIAVCDQIKNLKPLKMCEQHAISGIHQSALDMIDVHGQSHAKRALEIAAAGKHSVLFVGPPGTGKTMLASRLPSILPALTEQEALEVATLASLTATGFDEKAWRQIPLRRPHHSASSVALVGGGRPPKPGEISLAHHGILFLDELPEFSRSVLESLREPLESGLIIISRAAYQVTFPARFQLLAAMNPCPCGYAGSTLKECVCTRDQVQRYLNKISGPLLDRIDMHIEMPTVPMHVFSAGANGCSDNSLTISARVLQARQRQVDRQKKLNADLSTHELLINCVLDTAVQTYVHNACEQFKLSARVYHRLLRVARTIADLAQCETISQVHMSEALFYRLIDREKFIK